MAEKNEQQKPAEGGVRIKCTLPNASHNISGIAFAKVKIGDDEVHVSEKIPKEQADRMLTIEGYEPFGADGEHGRRIEDALTTSRKQAIQERAPSAEAPVRAQLEEQRRANRALGEELRAANAKVEELTGEIAKLKAENEQLKADGARVKKPAQPAAA